MRGWTAGSVVQGFRSSLDGNRRVECRVESVKHGTSPLAARTRGKQSDHKCFKASLLPSNVRLFDRRAAAYPSLSSSTRSRTPRSRSPHCRSASRFPLLHFSGPERAERVRHTGKNSDTERPLSYCYELPTQLRLESVANAHTAADLHVRPWVSYRAGQESLGRRERVTNTPRVISYNP